MAIDLRILNDDIFIDTVTGDFAFIESDTQHIKDIVTGWAGWWKEFPTVGVGVSQYLGRGGSVQFLKREIKVNLKADGYRTDKIIVTEDDQIFITGERRLT
jgi:hypothetical protein